MAADTTIKKGLCKILKAMEFLKARIFFDFFLAGFNAGLFLVLVKWRIIEYYSIHKRRWMPACNFCLFFWLAFFEVLYFITGAIFFSLVGFVATIMLSLCAAAISRKLV